MTKKDYIAIGNILQRKRTMLGEEGFDSLVAEFANLFEMDNPRFDKDKFYRYVYIGVDTLEETTAGYQQKGSITSSH